MNDFSREPDDARIIGHIIRRLIPFLCLLFIVNYLDQFVIGQEAAKKTVAVAVYLHFKKIAKSQQYKTLIPKSNVLLIGPSSRPG